MRKLLLLLLPFFILGCDSKNSGVDEIIIDNSINETFVKSIDISDYNEQDILDGWQKLPKEAFYNISVKFNDEKYWRYDIYKIDNDVLEVFTDESLNNSFDEERNIDRYTYYKYLGNFNWSSYIYTKDKTWNILEDNINYLLRDNSIEKIMFKKNNKYIDCTETQNIFDYKEVELKLVIKGKESYYYAPELGFNVKYTNQRFNWVFKRFNLADKTYPVDLPNL